MTKQDRCWLLLFYSGHHSELAGPFQ